MGWKYGWMVTFRDLRDAKASGATGKATMMVPWVWPPGSILASRSQRVEGVLLQGGEGLEVAVEVGRGSGVVTKAASGGLEIGFDGVNQVWFLAIVLEGNIDCDHGQILIGNLDRDDVIDRPGGCGLRTLHERDDTRNDCDNRGSNENDFHRRQVLLRSAEFFANVESGTGLRGGC